MARVLSPQERGGTYFARVDDSGTITLEPAAVVPAGEAAWLNNYLEQFREEIAEGAAKTDEELMQHLVD